MGRYDEYRKSMIGKKFNKLTVMEYLRVENQKSIFLLSCDCGNKKEMSLADVKNGRVKSCGCLNNTQGGLTKKTPQHKKIYDIYNNMMKRCYNEQNIYYYNYGGRGITVSDRWKDSFENFYKDITQVLGYPKEGDTLDRIDNNRGYHIENLKWSNMTEQNVNRRNRYSETSMKNIYKRGSSYRVKISRYGITIQSHNIKDLDRAKELRDFYVYLFSGTKEECEQLYKEQCYLKK